MKKDKLIKVILYAAAAFVLAAGCSPKSNETKVTPEPTATVAVTDTPTPVPTDTPTPTATPTPDTEAPVIIGVKDIQVKVNDTVSYTKDVSATDNSGEAFTFRGENPNMWVDTEKVDMGKAGTYPVTYHAKDSSGNETEVCVNVLVSPVSPEYVYELAQKVLDDILTADMTKYEKAEAIFKYVHTRIWYSEAKGADYLESASIGLESGKGDCNVSASVSKVLLDLAGIDNLYMQKSPADNDPHAWNLVNTGDGWYHFDAIIWHHDTADKDAVEKGIFMWTDERIASSGSRSIRNQHKYDKSMYPVVE